MSGLLGLGGPRVGLASVFAAPKVNPRRFHRWQGISGAWYVHTVVPINAAQHFDEVNYIFARSRPYSDLFDPLYIGQTSDWSDRARRHEKMSAALALGATHMHFHLLARDKFDRIRIETDLRHAWLTPLNEQRRGVLAGLLQR